MFDARLFVKSCIFLFVVFVSESNFSSQALVVFITSFTISYIVAPIANATGHHIARLAIVLPIVFPAATQVAEDSLHNAFESHHQILHQVDCRAFLSELVNAGTIPIVPIIPPHPIEFPVFKAA